MTRLSVLHAPEPPGAPGPAAHDVSTESPKSDSRTHFLVRSAGDGRYVNAISGRSAARAALARYEALLSAIPNAEILIAPLTVQEAVLSSRI